MMQRIRMIIEGFRIKNMGNVKLDPFHNYISKMIVRKVKKSKLFIDGGLVTRSNVIFQISSGELHIGRNVFINDNCSINVRESVEIGDGTIIGQNVLFYDHDHDYRHPELIRDHFITAKIQIGKNVWIGANCVILRGTEIQDGAVIAAGSVVKGLVPAHHLYCQKRMTMIRPISTE